MENHDTNKHFTKKFIRNNSPYKPRYFYQYNGRFRPEGEYKHRKHTYRKGKYPHQRYKKSRPASPVEGSEEYMSQKIQKTSAIIMRQLLSPDENIIPLQNDVNIASKDTIIPVSSKSNSERKRSVSFGVVESTLSQSSNELIIEGKYNRLIDTLETCEDTSQKPVTYNVEEIHSKIMNHISNLNDRRKKTLISTSTSVYDEAIHQILKQKRLEISRALRNVQMKTANVMESTELINSIIPDIGIKIEDLPHEVLEALQNTFNASEDEDNFSNSGYGEVQLPPLDDIIIKIEEEEEPIEVCEIMDIESDNDEIVENPIIKVEPSTEIDEIRTSKPVNIIELDDISKNQVINVEINADVDKITTDEVSTEINSTSAINKVFPEESEQSKRKQMLPETSWQIFQSIADPAFMKASSNLPRNTCDVSTQTKTLKMADFLQNTFSKPPKTFATATRRMLLIDKYVAKLTEYRQSLFTNLYQMKTGRKLNRCLNSRKVKSRDKTKNVLTTSLKKQKLTELPDVARRVEHAGEQNGSEDVLGSCEKPLEQRLLEFGNIAEKMLVMKVCEDKLVAGSESGKLFFFNLDDSKCTNIVEVSTTPITCFHFSKDGDGKPYLFIGYFGSFLKVFNFYSTSLLSDIHIDDNIQCIDEKWGYVFLGCFRSTIVRYSMKKKAIEYEEIFDGHPVFALSATQEGARMVLLIGSRNAAVVIRDAMSGLHLRTMENIIAPTVYSMIMEKNLVLCGTTTHNILVFNFHNGKLLHTYNATNSKGIRCMKIVGRCLFASCYNGKVYVFNLENNSHIGTMDGPGGVIISMEVLSNQVIIGTMSCKLSSIAIPQHILSYL